MIVRPRPQSSVGLAVILAVSARSKPSVNNLVQRSPGTVIDDPLKSLVTVTGYLHPTRSPY